MSGGHFDYTQHHIGDIADSIQSVLDRQGKEIPREDRWHDDDWYKKYPQDAIYPTYKDETQEEFRNAVHILRLAKIYAQRVDWFLSGDDGEETFHKRLDEELKNFENGNR